MEQEPTAITNTLVSSPNASLAEVPKIEFPSSVTVKLDEGIVQWISQVNKQDIIEIVKAFRPEAIAVVEQPFHQTHQVLLAGLCAVAAACIAFAGVWISSNNQRRIEKDKYDRLQIEKKNAWEGKKRFITFDIMNAATEMQESVSQAASYAEYFAENEAPPEYYIFQDDMEPEQISDLNFQKISEALRRISVFASSYPLKEEDLQHLTSEELNAVNTLGFRVKFVQSALPTLQQACHKLMKTWTPDDVVGDTDVQSDAHDLLKFQMKMLVKYAADVMDLSANVAKFFAPEIHAEYLAAQQKIDQQRAAFAKVEEDLDKKSKG